MNPIKERFYALHHFFEHYQPNAVYLCVKQNTFGHSGCGKYFRHYQLELQQARNNTANNRCPHCDEALGSHPCPSPEYYWHDEKRGCPRINTFQYLMLKRRMAKMHKIHRDAQAIDAFIRYQEIQGKKVAADAKERQKE